MCLVLLEYKAGTESRWASITLTNDGGADVCTYVSVPDR